MFVEFVSEKVIDGVAKVFKTIRYSNGKRVQRVYEKNNPVPVEANPLPPTEGYYGGLLNQKAYGKN